MIEDMVRIPLTEDQAAVLRSAESGRLIRRPGTGVYQGNDGTKHDPRDVASLVRLGILESKVGRRYSVMVGISEAGLQAAGGCAC